jgi:hypothetical protein
MKRNAVKVDKSLLLKINIKLELEVANVMMTKMKVFYRSGNGGCKAASAGI